MNDEYKKKIIRIVSIGSLILIACALVVFFVSEDINKLADRVESIRTQTLLDQSFLKTYNSLVDQRKNMIVDIDAMNGLLPTPDDLINIQAYIQNLGADSQVLTTISFEILNPASGNEPASQSFRLSLTGTLPNIRQFLTNLSSSPYFIKLDSFNIDKQNEATLGNTSIGIYLMNANGKIYVNDQNAK